MKFNSLKKFVNHNKKKFTKNGWKYVVLWMAIPFLIIFLFIRKGYKWYHFNVSNSINNKLKRIERKLIHFIDNNIK